MRTSHAQESSYIYQSILNDLYMGEVININNLAHKFDYDVSSIYKIIKKIDYNFATINSHLKIVKISPKCYQLEYDNKIISINKN